MAKERYLVNRTFDEIQVGDSSTLQRTLQAEDVKIFAIMTGDVNPAVLDPSSAEGGQRQVIAHGMWSGSLISTVLGTQLPGPGTILIDQSLHFSRPVYIGDTLNVTVTVKKKFEHNQHIVLDCDCVNQDGLQTVRGSAEVLAPSQKVQRLQRIELPDIRIDDKVDRLARLKARVRDLDPIKVAVAHPCDIESLRGAIVSSEAGIIEPILVGPETIIRSLAKEHQLDVSHLRIVNALTSRDSAAIAIALVRSGDAEALMKGSLHTAELMDEVVSPNIGLRGKRTISHVFVLDVPAYPGPLLITDAIINFAPNLQEKADIVQNAINLAHAIGIPEPKVAILSALERIDSNLPSTIDAAALCKMAERGQIKGGLLDGPLAFDNAVSLLAAKTMGIKSKVAGQADILVVPNMDSGNMMARQLEYLAGALTAGIILGAQAPIILTSRNDSAETRIASCVIASLVIQHKRALASLSANTNP